VKQPNKRIEFAPRAPDSQSAMHFVCGSFASFGTMKRVVIALLLAGLQMGSVSVVGDESSSDEADRVIALCEFPKVAASRFHAHGILLSDEKCPNVRVGC
jgi:hypothetical protein